MKTLRNLFLLLVGRIRSKLKLVHTCLALIEQNDILRQGYKGDIDTYLGVRQLLKTGAYPALEFENGTQLDKGVIFFKNIWPARMLSQGFYDMFAASPARNYLELELAEPGKPTMVVTLQMKDKITPATRARIAIDALKEAAQRPFCDPEGIAYEALKKLEEI